VCCEVGFAHPLIPPFSFSVIWRVSLRELLPSTAAARILSCDAPHKVGNQKSRLRTYCSPAGSPLIKSLSVITQRADKNRRRRSPFVCLYFEHLKLEQCGPSNPLSLTTVAARFTLFQAAFEAAALDSAPIIPPL
jgi:hypothetical protein